jgi:hypothetical protein
LRTVIDGFSDSRERSSPIRASSRIVDGNNVRAPESLDIDAIVLSKILPSIGALDPKVDYPPNCVRQTDTVAVCHDFDRVQQLPA